MARLLPVPPRQLSDGRHPRASGRRAAALPPYLLPMQSLVLLVDRDEDSVSLLTDVLEAHGYAVRAVASGMSADLVLRERVPALVLIDLDDPSAGGNELIRRIGRAPGLQKLPVVVGARHAEGLLSGAWAWLRKPYDPAALLELLEKYLGRSGAAAR
jgi:CheY-like chemotaxis protein